MNIVLSRIRKNREIFESYAYRCYIGKTQISHLNISTDFLKIVSGKVVGSAAKAIDIHPDT